METTGSSQSGETASFDGAVDSYASVNEGAINLYASPQTGIDIAVGAIDQAYHYGAITTEQANLINNSVDIQVYGIVHGSYNDQFHTAPDVEIEYQSAQEIVDSLDATRGDVLFTELYGRKGVGVDGDWASIEPDPDKQEAYIEGLRESRTILPGAYLVEKARLAGVTVIAADMHEDIAQAFTDETGLTAQDMLSNQSDPHAEIWNHMRVEQTANTLKDFTIAAQPWNLPERPTYAVSIGKAHTHEATGSPYDIAGAMKYGGLPGALGNLGLNYELTEKANAVHFREERLTQIASHAGHLPVANIVEVDEHTPLRVPTA